MVRLSSYTLVIRILNNWQRNNIHPFSMKVSLKNFINPVFSLLQSLKKGEVITYGEVAKRCGLSNPRHVGWILKQNTDPDKVPCYKVVHSDGSLSNGYKFGGPKEQRRRLDADRA